MTDTGDTMTFRPMTIETTIQVIRIFDRFRTLHTHNLQSSSLKHAYILPAMVSQLLLAPLDRTYMRQDVNHRVVKSDIINFPNNRQGNRHLNHQSVEQLRVANEPVLNQANSSVCHQLHNTFNMHIYGPDLLSMCNQL
uniref:Uncharacterized protein n=1 Tax=Tanacetum cinerariifolium TaxID=118510 RepID=A0A6L2LU88_TANCI|nr:hypothetical protein [Tanacetum cinerariifolium]